MAEVSYLLSWFNAELSQKMYWLGPKSQEVEERVGTIPIATLLPPE